MYSIFEIKFAYSNHYEPTEVHIPTDSSVFISLNE